jgi:outer membrane protein assembly factor BamB
MACLGADRARAEDALVVAAPPMANAVAEVDAEANMWLNRFLAAVRSGEPENALPLLMRLLRAGPVAMGSTNGVTYLPVRKLVIGLIRELPESFLELLLLQKEALTKKPSGRAQPAMDLAALATLHGASLPDAAAAEAGMRLAGIYLDQARFVKARRVLLDLLEEYPPDLVPRAELLPRLVVACARVGDSARAQWAWDELQKQGETNRWASLAEELRLAEPQAALVSNGWPMAYGGPLREGAVWRPAAEQAGCDQWIPIWGVNVGPGIVRDGHNPEGATNLPAQYCVGRSYATTCMTEKNYRPSDDLVFAGNKAWVNTFGECLAVDLVSGRAVQRTPHVTDDPANDPPGAADGGWVFGNRLNRAASLIGKRVYCVEDNYRSSFKPRSRERMEWAGGRYVARALPCGNALAAYDADTGRLVWRVGREVPAKTPEKNQRRWSANALRFAAAPVSCGGLLLAPVEDESGSGVAGFDADSGALVWRTRLTPRFPTAEPRASPVNVTADGACAYVCGGKGAVSALDGYDGTVLWTTLYEPSAVVAASNAVNADGSILWSNRYVPLCVSSGIIPVDRGIKPETKWEESLTLIVGEALVVMPEDSGEILAINRRTGQPLWKQRKPEGVNYVVGRRGTRLIVAGKQRAAGVDLTDGREQWRALLAGSTGRGALYGSEVLIPYGRRILRLRIEDGVALEPARAQTMDDLPLGNLCVNGNQLLVTGLERLYALADARPVFTRLAESLAQQPTAAAYAERGRVYAGLERDADAVADLREAWKRQRGSAGEAAARAEVLTALWRAAAQDPGTTEKFCAEAREIAVTAAERAETAWRWAQGRERSGDTNGALSLYAALASEPDASLAPNPGDSDWEASAHRLAAQRIRTLLAGDAVNRGALLEEPAAQALAKLGSSAGNSALVELATFFPGTRAGQQAAIRAAQMASGRGDLGTAEAILQRTLALAAPSNRVLPAEQLVRLYERMKWPTGAVQLRDEWPRLSAGTPAPDSLTRAAANAIGVPLPPWRLRWQKRLPGGTELRHVAAGLFYWNGEAKHTGCLNVENGQERWQKDGAFATFFGYTTSEDSHLLLTFTGDRAACVDVWSGVVMTDGLFRGNWDWLRDSGGHDHSPMTLSPIGMTTVNLPGSYANFAGVDVLTGQVAWQRRDMDTLLDWLMWSMPVSWSAESVVLSTIETDETRLAVALDPWTGAVTGRRSFGGGVFEEWAQRMAGKSGSEDVHAMERGSILLQDRRLSVKNLRTGAVIWRSAPELGIVRYNVMPGGMIVAQNDADELLLLSGEDGQSVFRSTGTRFIFENAVNIGNTVYASRATGNGTNEVMVIDPVGGRIVFQGPLPQETKPCRVVGAGASEQLLVSVERSDGGWLQVVNNRETNTSPWRLPRSEDIRRAPRGRYYPVFADGLILMIGDNQVLAYEHDPQEDGKKP